MSRNAEIIVIVVTYNGLQWIDRCLGSVADPRGAIHTVVVDNGSTDGTVEAIKARFPDVELILPEKNLGFGHANNLGMKIALDRKAEFVFLLNQDAWLQPGALETMLESARKYPAYGILSPIHLNGAGTGLDYDFSKYVVPTKCPGFYSDLAVGQIKSDPYPLPFVNAAVWLVTARCLNVVGGFNPSFFHYGEDDNYIQRCAYHGFLIGVSAKAIAHHDRETRSVNKYFDPEVLELRRSVLNYSDPRTMLDPVAEKRNLVRRIIQRTISLQRTELKKALSKRKVLLDTPFDKVLDNRKKSLRVGPTFL